MAFHGCIIVVSTILYKDFININLFIYGVLNETGNFLL